MPLDRSKQEFDDFYKTLCWPALPYGDARIKQLSEKFEVTGIPQFIILDGRTGFCVSKLAKKDINEAAKAGTEEAVQAVFANWGKL